MWPPAGFRISLQSLEDFFSRPCALVERACVEHCTDMIVACIAAVVVYGAFLFVPGFHIDDELSAVYGTTTIDIEFGRWTTAFVRTFLIPGPFNGYFTTLISLLFLCLSSIFLMNQLRLSRVARTAGIVLFIAFPQFCYQLEFHVQSDVVAAGYAMAILSAAVLAWLPTHHHRSSRVMCILAAMMLMVIAIGIYQPIILLPLTVSLLVSLTGIQRGDGVRLTFGRPALTLMVSIGACAVHLIASKLLLQATGLPGVDSYFAGYFGWDSRPTYQTLLFILESFRGIPRSLSYYGESLYGFSLVPACILLLASRQHGERRVLTTLLLLVALLVSPYAIPIALGSPQSARTFVSQAFVFAGVWAIAIEFLCMSTLARLGRGFAVLAVLLLVLGGSFCSSRLAFADFIQWKADCALGTRIADAVYRKYGDFDSKSEAVFFYGNYKQMNFWRRSNYDVFGASFFDWGPDSTDRVDTFMTVSGLADFHAPAVAERPRLLAMIQTLPTWPNAASISRADGAILVHLGR